VAQPRHTGSKVRSREVVEADADIRVVGGRAPSRSYECDVRMVGAERVLHDRESAFIAVRLRAVFDLASFGILNAFCTARL
jgi:hypothetical protein